MKDVRRLERKGRRGFFRRGLFVAKCFEGWVYCFLMQIVMNKCFLLDPKKIGADPSWQKPHSLIPKKRRHRAEGYGTLIIS